MICFWIDWIWSQYSIINIFYTFFDSARSFILFWSFDRFAKLFFFTLKIFTVISLFPDNFQSHPPPPPLSFFFFFAGTLTIGTAKKKCGQLMDSLRKTVGHSFFFFVCFIIRRVTLYKKRKLYKTSSTKKRRDKIKNTW